MDNRHTPFVLPVPPPPTCVIRESKFDARWSDCLFEVLQIASCPAASNTAAASAISRSTRPSLLRSDTETPRISFAGSHGYKNVRHSLLIDCTAQSSLARSNSFDITEE